LGVRLTRTTGLEAAAVVVGMGKLGGLDVVGSGDFEAGSTPDRVVSWQFGNAIVANVLYESLSRFDEDDVKAGVAQSMEALLTSSTMIPSY
jgi:hypothetical protein